MVRNDESFSGARVSGLPEGLGESIALPKWLWTCLVKREIIAHSLMVKFIDESNVP